jgi:hypothetical protein
MLLKIFGDIMTKDVYIENLKKTHISGSNNFPLTIYKLSKGF